MLNLRQIANDMRAAGEMLIEGANQIDKAINVDMSGLAALAQLLGGDAVKSAPFIPKEPKTKLPVSPAERAHPQNKEGLGVLTASQKEQVRSRWKNLPEATRQSMGAGLRLQWAKEFNVNQMSVNATLSNNTAIANKYRYAKKEEAQRTS